MQTPSENTDVKLDTLDEPSAHLIEENVALPKEIFSSYWSYVLYEMAHYKLIVIVLLLNVCLVLLFLFFHDGVLTILFYLLSLIFCLPMLGASVGKFTKPIRNQDFEINLLVEVIKRKPAVRGKEWRTITYNMNQYLFDHGLWNTPYRFYDEEDCHRYFLHLIEGKTFKKQGDPPTSNVTDAQSNDETAGTPNEAIEFFTFHSGPNYQKYKLGMHISLESTDTKLDTSNEPSAQLIEENVALPKDIFHSYLSYWIYEAAHCTPVMFLSLVIGVLISIIILFHDNENCVGVSVGFLVIFFIIFGCVLGGIFGIPISDRDFKIKLLGETIARRPAGREWRTVAYNMNQYLFDEGLWYTPYYFYCGRKCQYFFNNLVKIEGPNTHPSSPTNDEENTQPDASEIEVLNVVGRFFIHSPDPILEAYLIKAAEINREAEFEYWRKQYPELAILIRITSISAILRQDIN
ncbi:CLL_collapsed_G0000780.mRNA.1.CDS.1 [Saccharomyces cerevisiae]|nr:CLL_HP2_G0000770.mRNA.1.CDS.1 [Saccharomyces cerevisiae]CAI6384392.1 CLL_HP1_G0000760.mRNA.1.CDS.1 [Saccharomyces cerevisiae]CAI6452708.1 CLL_HP2_G0000770.mRNA.1.CDS.1 [Saccharomyces cerevisiae]CAI7128944.1 CLL_collapsed_G0000780.mRNA.1.CDS.1 [Saccharomyces cerevisiae]